jgi:hypothetical protein
MRIESGEILRPPAEVLEAMTLSGRGIVVEVGAPEGFTAALAARLEARSQLLVIEPEGLVPKLPVVSQVRSVPRGVVPQLALVWLSPTRPATVLRTLAPKLSPGARLWVVLPAGEGLEHPVWNRAAMLKAVWPRGLVERGPVVAVSNRREARLLGQGMVPPPR